MLSYHSQSFAAPAHPPRSQRMRLRAADGGRTGTEFIPYIVAETTVMQQPDETLRIYFTKDVANNVHQIALTTAPRIGGPWTEPVPLIGVGLAGTASSRVAHSSYVVRQTANGPYYCYAANGFGNPMPGQDRQLYLYKSPDGLSGWQDLGLCLPNSAFANIVGYGNACIALGAEGFPVPVNGKYVGFMEATDLACWKIYRAEAPTLEGPWTITGLLGQLRANPGAMTGGACCYHLNGVFHMWYHYGAPAGISSPGDLGPNLPTWLAYATSADGFDWVVAEAPMFELEALPFGVATAFDNGTTQIADAQITQIREGGQLYTYLTAGYVTNTSPTENQSRWWRFPGSITQLVTR